MQNRTPVPRDQRPPLPAFTPVPRKLRHDGWTPERQRAFIAALADTGAVSRAAAMVNMSPVGAYYLRRQPGADEFRRAWEAALDYGVARMKDIAFERAIEGYLVPMLLGGKLIGWRRKYNDRLLMFCLRHYGQDDNGKRTTVNYFSTKATAGAASSSPERGLKRASRPGDGGALEGPPQPMVEGARVVEGAQAHAEASTTTVRTSIVGKGEPADLAAALGATAATLDDFAGVELDACAQDEILAVLHNCAARQRAVEGTANDEREPFIAAIQPLRQVMAAEPGYSIKTLQWRRDDPVHDIAVHPAELLEQSPLPDIETERSNERLLRDAHIPILAHLRLALLLLVQQLPFARRVPAP